MNYISPQKTAGLRDVVYAAPILKAKGSIVAYLRMYNECMASIAERMLGQNHGYVIDLRKSCLASNLEHYLSVTEDLLTEWCSQWKEGVSVSVAYALRHIVQADMRTNRLAFVATLLDCLINKNRPWEYMWTEVEAYEHGRTEKVYMQSRIHSLTQIAYRPRELRYKILTDSRVPWRYLLPEPWGKYKRWFESGGLDHLYKVWSLGRGVNGTTQSAMAKLNWMVLMPSDNAFGAWALTPKQERIIVVPSNLSWVCSGQGEDDGVPPNLTHEMVHIEDFSRYSFLISSTIMETRALTAELRCRLRAGQSQRAVNHAVMTLSPYVQLLQAGLGSHNELHIDRYFWTQIVRFAQRLSIEEIERLVTELGVLKTSGYQTKAKRLGLFLHRDFLALFVLNDSSPSCHQRKTPK